MTKKFNDEMIEKLAIQTTKTRERVDRIEQSLKGGGSYFRRINEMLITHRR